MNRISLKEWFEKHAVSGGITSTEYAIKRAIEHEQNKYELETIKL